MKMTIETKKPEEIEEAFKIIKEDAGELIGKFDSKFKDVKIKFDVSWEKINNNVFVFRLDYTGENILSNWKRKREMMQIFRMVDSEVKEL